MTSTDGDKASLAESGSGSGSVPEIFVDDTSTPDGSQKLEEEGTDESSTPRRFGAMKTGKLRRRYKTGAAKLNQ